MSRLDTPFTELTRWATGTFGGEVDEQVDILTLAVELNQITLEVRTYFVEDGF